MEPLIKKKQTYLARTPWSKLEKGVLVHRRAGSFLIRPSSLHCDSLLRLNARSMIKDPTSRENKKGALKLAFRARSGWEGDEGKSQ